MMCVLTTEKELELRKHEPLVQNLREKSKTFFVKPLQFKSPKNFRMGYLGRTKVIFYSSSEAM
jgi:hypothetical protein